MKHLIFRRFASLTLLLILSACNGRDKKVGPMPTVSVETISLAPQNFKRSSFLTGSVQPYREEKISFEVGGRVLAVMDEGFEVTGPAFDESGEMVQEGEVVAEIEDTRYRLQIDSLTSRKTALEKELEVFNSQQILARQTRDRAKRVLETGGGTQQSVDNAESALDQVGARVEVQTNLIVEVEEKLKSALEDLADTKLLAPFTGRNTAVHVTQGSVVDAGTPVITLTVMDPIQVMVEVSADDERQIRTGDRAVVFPKAPGDSSQEIPVNAVAYQRSSVANPNLRTFQIDLMVRNERRKLTDPDKENLPIAEEFLPVVRRFKGEEGPLFVPLDAIYEQSGKKYALRLPGLAFHEGSTRGAVGRHQPEKIEIKFAEEYMTVVKWNFRSLSEPGSLREGDFLVLGGSPAMEDGLMIGEPQWLLRPGDLIPVQFVLANDYAEGFYVPIQAIQFLGGDYSVFLLEEGVARKTPVTVHDSVGELRRIEGGDLKEGALLITTGSHYVSDGQPVVLSKPDSEGP